MSNIVKLRRSPRTVHVRTEHKKAVGKDYAVELGLANFSETPQQPQTQSHIEQDGEHKSAEIYQQGYQLGVQETEVRMRADFERNLENERARVTTVLGSLDERWEEHRRSLEQSAAKFALAVAKMILKREVTLDREIVFAQIKEALKRVVGVERITLRVNPQDEDIVRAHRSTLAEGTESIREMVIELDAAVERGGCILESDSGNVDARLATQLRRIEEALFESNMQ